MLYVVFVGPKSTADYFGLWDPVAAPRYTSEYLSDGLLTYSGGIQLRLDVLRP